MSEKKVKSVKKPVTGYKSGDTTKLAITILLLLIAFILGLSFSFVKKEYKNNHRKDDEKSYYTKDEIDEKLKEKTESEPDEQIIDIPVVTNEQPEIESINDEN